MSERSERMKVASESLLDCPFCGKKASPIIVFPSSDPYEADQEFWSDATRMPECERAGCQSCGCAMDAEKWQYRANNVLSVSGERKETDEQH
jgi:hypothetical protein